MIRTLVLVPLASLLLAPATADDPKLKERSAVELLSAAVDRAKDEGNEVFLLFGSPG
jgi:hypothetical protein